MSFFFQLAKIWISRAVKLFEDLVLDQKLEVEVKPTQPFNVKIYIRLVRPRNIGLVEAVVTCCLGLVSSSG